MNRKELTGLAKAFRAGKLSLEDFLAKAVPVSETASAPSTARLDHTSVDLDRQQRCGYPEVVYAEGKSSEALVAIVERLLEAKQPVLATRVSAEQAEVLAQQFEQGQYNPVGRTYRHQAPETAADGQAEPLVAIVSAGTSDLPVVEEARETLAWMGIPARVVHDCGVAGPHRLVERLPELEQAAAVIVVAGMEGALPSVVGGYLAVPIIAVPTSVGYGANFGGLAALLGMLNSCAANVTVVNIDAGFKAAYVAGLMVRARQ